MVCLSWMLWVIHAPVSVVQDSGLVIDVLARLPNHAHQANTFSVIATIKLKCSPFWRLLLTNERAAQGCLWHYAERCSLKETRSSPMQTWSWQRQMLTDASRGPQPMKSCCPGTKAPPSNCCINRFSWQVNSSLAMNTSTLKDSL